MSLLLEALKKAEKAKEDAQRQTGRPTTGDAGLQLEMEPAADAKHVFTRDELPSIASGVDITSEDLGAAPPPPPAAAPPRPAPEAPPPRAATRASTAAPEPAPEARAAAKKVFEAKFKEPNPKLPFYIVMGLLGAFAVGTIVYFWYQLRPPPPLVNPNPPKNPAEQVVNVPDTTPAPSAAPKPAASAPAAEIPGLPDSKSATPASSVTAPTSTTTSSAAPAGAPPPPRAPIASEAPPTPSAAPAPRVATTPPARPAPAPAPAAASPRGERAPVATRKPAPAVDPNVDAGYQAYQAGDLAAARTGYERALRTDPGNRDALLGLAAVETRAQNAVAAEALYRRVLRADPRDSHALAGLLSLRPDSADPVATESRIKSMIANEPDSATLQFTLGAQYAQQARWPEAQQAFFKALAADPENPDFAYNLAVSLDHLRQPKLALEYYRRALALAEKRGAAFDRAAAQARAQELGR